MKKIDKTEILYIFLLLQPFIDLSTSLIARFLETPFTIGVITRGLFLGILVIYTLFIVKTKYKKKTILYFISILFFIILYFITKKDIFTFDYLKSEIIYLFKYFYFPVVSVCLLNCFKILKIDKEKINKIFIINAIVFAILIIVPFITNTGFSSYMDNSKGSVGWFYAANEIGAILTMLFPYLYCLLYEKSSNKFMIFSLILIAAMMIIGTKTAFFGMILTEIVFLVYFLIIKDKNKRLSYCVVILAMSTILVPALPATNNLQSSIDNNLEQDNIEVEDDENIEVNTFIDKSLNIVLSGRQNYLYNTIDIYKERNTSDKLFGIGFVNRDSINNKDIEKLIEIDPLDIFFHYGIIGFILYFLPLIYIYIKSIYNVLKRKLYLSFNQLLYLYSITLLMVISLIAGHILSSPAVSIYLAFTLMLLYKEINIIPKDKLKEDEVTILALHLGYGGVEQYISSLCKMLDNNYKINIITTYKVLDKPAFYFSDKVKITYLMEYGPNKEELKSAIKSKNIINILKEGLKSIKILYLKKYKNIDAIKNIDSKYIITTRSFHNKLVGSYANINIVKIATEHNYHNNDKKYIYNTIKSLKNFEYFVVVSNTLKEFYENKLKHTKCIYIPNVIDELPKKESDLKENNIICIGRLEKEKDHDNLIDVLSLVKEKIKDVKLYLIGGGSLRINLENKVKEKNLEDDVIFTGFISKKEMEKYLIKSKLFVMTSITESFGLVLIEAMSYKVPCIAYDSATGACELLKDNIGILVKNREKEVMAKEIVKLLKNEKELKKLSDNSYKHCQNYLLENVKETWLDLLNKC